MQFVERYMSVSGMGSAGKSVMMSIQNGTRSIIFTRNGSIPHEYNALLAQWHETHKRRQNLWREMKKHQLPI